MTTRVGIGFDAHRFSEDSARQLILGGILFKDQPGLDGHSDADVVAHAIVDALLGAACLGDIGTYFPDTDERWRGADSMTFLAETSRMLAAMSARINNVDCTIVAETPKISLHREEMQSRLCSVLDATVNVKASRTEKMGAIGRKEGVSCIAIAAIEVAGI